MALSLSFLFFWYSSLAYQRRVCVRAMAAVAAQACGTPFDAKSLGRLRLEAIATMRMTVVRDGEGHMHEFLLQRMRRSPRLVQGADDPFIHCVAFDVVVGGAQTQTHVLTLPPGAYRILTHNGADGSMHSVEVWPEASVEAVEVRAA